MINDILSVSLARYMQGAPWWANLMLGTAFVAMTVCIREVNKQLNRRGLHALAVLCGLAGGIVVVGTFFH